MVDGDGGLAREGLRQLLLARGEGPPPAEGQHADGPLADQERHPEVVRVAEALVRGQMVGQHPARRELAHERLTGGEHPAGQALAHLDPRPEHGLDGGAGEARHHQVVAVEQPEARVVDVEQSRRLLGDGDQQALRSRERPDLLVDLEQRGQGRLAVTLLGEEPRVVERGGRLPRERGHDRDLFRRGRVGLPPVGGERAMRIALGEQGDGQDRAVPLTLDQPPRLRADRQGRVVQHVLAPHRHPLLDRAAGGALTQTHAQRGDELGRESAAALVGHHAGFPVDPHDADRGHPQQCPAPVHDQVQDAVDVEGRADRAAHLEERLVLGRVAGGLVEETRVLERHRGLRGEVGQGGEVFLGERRPRRARAPRSSRPGAGRPP